MPETPRLGPRRGLLPDLSRPVREERPRPEARAAGAVGQPAHRPRLQGRRPARGRRAPRLPRGAGDHGAVLQSDLPVGVQPSLPHVRLHGGRPAPRWRRGAPRAPRRGPRPGHARRPRRGLQPREPRVLALPPRDGDGDRVAVPRLVLLRRGGPGGRPADPRLPGHAAGPGHRVRAGGADGGRASLALYGYRAWWDLPALPKLNIDEPARSASTSSASPSTGSAWVPTAGASMSRWRSPTRTSGGSSGAG